MSDPNMDAADNHCDIQSAAFDDFELWQAHQSDDLLERTPLIQQAAHYARDDDWHNKTSETAYDFRNN